MNCKDLYLELIFHYYAPVEQLTWHYRVLVFAQCSVLYATKEHLDM